MESFFFFTILTTGRSVFQWSYLYKINIKIQYILYHDPYKYHFNVDQTINPILLLFVV